MTGLRHPAVPQKMGDNIPETRNYKTPRRSVVGVFSQVCWDDYFQAFTGSRGTTRAITM